MKPRTLLLCIPLFWALALRADPVSLGNGHVQYTPPSDPWVFVNLTDDGTAAVYRSPVGHGTMLLAFVGKKAPQPGQEDAVRAEVHKVLVANFRRKDAERVTEPRIENDGRFFLVIFEQWRREGKLSSQWHIYRNLPPHQVVVTALVISQDEKEIAQTREAAESLATSVELVADPKKAPAPPRPATPTASPAMEKMTTAVEDAQKKLDEATAACVAKLEKDPKYQGARKAADAAEAKLRAARAADPPDRDAIGAASRDWITAKGELEGIKKEAFARDEAVVAARKALADAKAGK